MQPYHEELSGKAWSMWQHNIPQNIFFRKLQVIIIRPWTCWHQDYSLLTGPGISPMFIIELHVLQSLFVRGSNKKQRGRIISNFISYLYQPSDNVAMWSPLILHPSKKALSFSFSLSKKRTYLETQLKGEFIYWFILKIDRVLPVPSGRVGIEWWTLL